MIAANDTDMAFLVEMQPDQLRRLVAHAGGLLAHHSGARPAALALRRVADRLERPSLLAGLIYLPKAALSAAVLNDAVEQASEHTGVLAEDILGRDNSRRVAQARHWAMYLLRELSGPDGLPRYSFPEIGRAFNRDHTTVIAGVRRVRQRLASSQAACA